MIRLENISKKYGDKTVLEKFNHIFPDSGFVAINGKSGIGKTTLLNILLGFEIPNDGQIVYSHKENNQKSTGQNNCLKLSVVFQEDRLIECENVLENILFVMNEKKFEEEKNIPLKDANIKKASEILEKLGLGNEINEMVFNLSGGMKRRVAIARCLAVDADVYIMDEPIKGLDIELQKKTLDVIHEYTDEREKLLIMVTHNPEEIEGCNDIITLDETMT